MVVRGAPDGGGRILPRVLFVDDEPNVLDALRRQLRRDYSVEVAVGGANGLFLLGRSEPFAVIVSDYLMPGINGADFLAAARKAAPTATRMLLTGHADLKDAAAAINRGQVFRMLLKPVDQETMTAALRECVEHHRLLVAERELLEQTLNGSVKALIDVLSLTSPVAFGRATRMRRLASAVLDHMTIEDRWAVELATMMSQLGVVSLPPEVCNRLDDGSELNATERAMVDEIPTVAQQLISPIPRMAPVAEAIHYSRKGFDGSGPPDDRIVGEQIPLGGRMLRLVQDYDAMTSHGVSAAEAVATLNTRSVCYDPDLLKALAVVALDADAEKIRGVALVDLQPGMILAAGVCSRSTVLLAKGGQEVTVSLITRLRNFAAMEDGVAEPLMVHGPTSGS